METAELLVSELVTNAVRHPAPQHVLSWLSEIELQPITMTLACRPGLVTISVWDTDPTPPQLRKPTVSDESGRGLFVLNQLAARWDYYLPQAGGKVVWCELTAPP